MNERRTSLSWIPTVSAALLAAFVMVACGTTGERQPLAVDPTERSVLIRLEVDPNNQPIRVIDIATDDPDSKGKELALKRSANDDRKREHAHWTVDPPWVDVKIDISLKQGSLDPFEKKPIQAVTPKHVFSPKVRKDTILSKDLKPGEVYAYWVKVYVGNKVLDCDTKICDPTIRIDP